MTQSLLPLAPAAQPAAVRHQRRFRNYLLDAPFQLKYTGYLVATAIVLSAALGTLLWSVSHDVILESQETVRQGQETVVRGQQVVRESQKVSTVVHMNIVKDPVYASNPELASVFNESTKEQDLRLQDQQHKLETDALGLRRRSDAIARQQNQMFVVLVTVLSLLVMGIGIVGIIVTHRVAGPIFKMKRLLGFVGDGHLHLTDKLRKGDELQHFFDAFERMVQKLRARQEIEISKLDQAIGSLDGQVSDGHLSVLRNLRKEMKDTLESAPPSVVPA